MKPKDLMKLLNEIRLELRKPDVERDYRGLSRRINFVESLVKTDGLTGLGNDIGLEGLIDSLEPERKGIGISILDIKGLKFVNDNFGRDQGDKLILIASAYLRSTIRYEDIFRAGQRADEFYIVSRDMARSSEQKLIARLVHESTDQSLEVCHGIGIVRIPLVFAYGYSVNDGEISLRETMTRAYEMLNENKRKLKEV
jgi:diguanylate cyclase (GGDEF)-like protein